MNVCGRRVIELGDHCYLCLPRDAMTRYVLKIPHVVISINEIGGELQPINRYGAEYRLDVLRLAFSDVLQPIGRHEPISYADARKIVDFAGKWEKKAKAIVVHCHAGISRSTATAAAIATLRGSNPLEFWQNYCPNPVVFSQILTAAYTLPDEVLTF